ncbi:MAG: hypothetical protein LBN08_07380 [Lactobacillales bacterium]|jgi:chromosome segregation ATPase|nr:hypothetical protein [Lactobacillales bacterium]
MSEKFKTLFLLTLMILCILVVAGCGNKLGDKVEVEQYRDNLQDKIDSCQENLDELFDEFKAREINFDEYATKREHYADEKQKYQDKLDSLDEEDE